MVRNSYHSTHAKATDTVLGTEEDNMWPGPGAWALESDPSYLDGILVPPDENCVTLVKVRSSTKLQFPLL